MYIPPLPGSKYLKNPLRRPLGLEIELSQLGRIQEMFPRYRIVGSDGQQIVSWNWVRDGSITPGGSEMVVNPLEGDNYLKGMEALVEGLLQSGAKVDGSCGLHVHVGGTDLSAWELRRILRGYLTIQKEVYRLVEPSRINSRFCKPYAMDLKGMPELLSAKSQEEIKSALIQLLYALPKPDATVKAMKREKYQQARYFGLNLHSWMLRGTVEWRHCEGTLDVEKLVIWPLFCGWVTDTLAKLTDEETERITCLADLVNGIWKREFSTIGIPDVVAEWVQTTLEKRRT